MLNSNRSDTAVKLLQHIHSKFTVCMLVKSSPITGTEGPREFQEVKVPRFRDNITGWW